MQGDMSSRMIRRVYLRACALEHDAMYSVKANGPTGVNGLSWLGSLIQRRIARLSKRRKNAPRCRRIEADLLCQANTLETRERVFLIGCYLRKRPDWPEGEAYLICAAL